MNTLLTELCEYLKVKPQYLELLNERDTSDVWRQFAIWLLVDPDDGVLRFTNLGSLQYKAINRVADLYIQDCKDADAWKEAYVAACAAASAAYAANSADAAAWCATSGAAYAANSAYAAYAANSAWSATAATAASAAWCDTAYYERMADKLIELINAAPMMK